ncbi:Dihydroneopterin aldolase [Bienertia sinuspersici]
MVKIDEDDVINEINYWSFVVVCYVLGANPPFSVMSGLCNRIWGKHGLEKVAIMGRGLFLVRFNSMEQCDKVVAGDPQFFDHKSVIIKMWDPDMELHKESVKTIPIWIGLPTLELKFWGSKCLHKLGDNIWKTIKIDQMTSNKERLSYARIMVEVGLDKELRDKICFKNEKGIPLNNL